MDKLVAWWKTSKWAVLAVLSGIALIVGFVLRSLFTGSKPSEPGIPPPPSALKQAVEQAHEDSLKARIVASTQAQEHHEKLAEIAKIDDGVERRKKLAEMLKTI
jgi:hypothetical protein